MLSSRTGGEREREREREREIEVQVVTLTTQRKPSPSKPDGEVTSLNKSRTGGAACMYVQRWGVGKKKKKKDDARTQSRNFRNLICSFVFTVPDRGTTCCMCFCLTGVDGRAGWRGRGVNSGCLCFFFFFPLSLSPPPLPPKKVSLVLSPSLSL